MGSGVTERKLRDKNIGTQRGEGGAEVDVYIYTYIDMYGSEKKR